MHDSSDNDTWVFCLICVSASYMGIKEFVPPYLDPSLSIKEMMTGVSFASAGSGFDPLTSGLSVNLDLSPLLKNFLILYLFIFFHASPINQVFLSQILL